MRIIDEKQIKKIKEFIFKNGRLLERKIFSFFFENGKKDDVIKALVAYQNRDGGFGNGIEPDLLCPDSTAIGAETAMFYLDLLEYVDNEITDQLFSWIIKEQNEEGYINHPPKNMYNYPFQKWWEGIDDFRILTLSGFLKKWGLDDAGFFKRVKDFFANISLPEELSYYEYPYFVYLKYLGENQGEKKMMQNIITQLPSLFKNNKEHYPLFSRAWYHALDNVDKKVIENEADNFFNGLQDDGGPKIIYQDLPWWRPIWIVDGLILLKKSGIIEF
ncbi:MAG: hypothetical protein ACXAC5_10825 [Promethearchaeota archaeon]|jgi:hypothetical protein